MSQLVASVTPESLAKLGKLSQHGRMSQDQSTAYIPQWTQGDRLRKARTLTGKTVREFAEHIGVSHGTITNAETDSRAVRSITLKAWALATGVSQEWLETGVNDSRPTPPDGPRGNNDELARMTRQKKARTRGATTRRYLAPTAA